MKTVFWKLNFGIMFFFKYLHVIITSKTTLAPVFLEIKFRKMNEISKISENINFLLYGTSYYLTAE